jgi:hypothetical protein
MLAALLDYVCEGYNVKGFRPWRPAKTAARFPVSEPAGCQACREKGYELCEKEDVMHVGVSMVGLLFVLVCLLVFALGIAAFVIALVALGRASKNAREISDLKSGRTPDR